MTEPWLTWSDRDAMAAEYSAGATIRGLASKHHHKYATVGRWLRNVGIIRRQGPQAKTLSSIKGADKGKTAGILAEYRKGTPICVMRAMFHVGSAVVYRITDRAGLPRRERGQRPKLPKAPKQQPWAPHKIPAAVKLARMRGSATWRAFFLAVLLEGRGPVYAMHLISMYRRQTDPGRSEERAEAVSR